MPELIACLTTIISQLPALTHLPIVVFGEPFKGPPHRFLAPLELGWPSA